MTAVDIFKASRMKQIEDTTVVGGLVDPSGTLLLTTRAGAEIEAGNVVGPVGPGFTYRGPWTATTPYLVDDVVTANGSTFVVTAVHTSGSTAPTESTPGANLALWAKKGDPGASGIQGSVAIPAGTISLWASDVAPANWMICDGAAVSRTTYASLFSAIGIKYGAGDGVTTFNLPNLKGRTPVGLDAAQTEFNTLAKIGGEKAHLLTAAESGLPAHNHIQGDAGVNNQGGYGVAPTAPAASNVNTQSGQSALNHPYTSTTGPTDAAAAHNILQPYSVVNFIIKVTAGDTPGDSELTQRISALEASYGTTPAGTISAWGADTAPPNWLLCDGAAVSRTTYATLFAAIGTKFGVGNGTTTFNLPDLRGRTLVGKDAAQSEFDVIGETGGAKTHLLTTAEMPAHTHTISTDDMGPATGFANIGTAMRASTSNYTATIPSSSTGGGGAHNNLQPYSVVNYIIKTTQGITPGDSQLAARVAVLEAQISATALQLRDKMQRIQRVMTGGGTRKSNTTGVSWNQRFIVIGAGWEDPALSGYWDIAFPPNGTVIPVYGSTTATTSIVANSEIPMNGWFALYYDIPLDGSFTSDPSRFKMVGYQSKLTFTPPPTWVLVVARNTDAGHAAYTWGDGTRTDYWHPFTPGNGWVQFSNYSPIGWKWKADGSIQLRGLMSSGTQGTVVADWGVAMAPEKNSIFVGYSNTATARLDVSDVGTLIVNGYTAGGSNAWVSLENVNWFPKGT